MSKFLLNSIASMMMQLLRTELFFLLVICTSNISSSELISCQDDDECPSNYLCINSRCSRGPTGTGIRCKSSCSSSASCIKFECQCVSSNDCLYREFCTHGNCKVNCVYNNQCANGQICRNGTCSSCLRADECDTHQYCQAGRCRTESRRRCEFESECDTYERCIGKLCQGRKLDGPCDRDEHCLSNQTCIRHVCSDHQCLDSDDCGVFEKCEDRICIDVFGDFSIPVKALLVVIVVTFVLIAVLIVKRLRRRVNSRRRSRRQSNRPIGSTRQSRNNSNINNNRNSNRQVRNYESQPPPSYNEVVDCPEAQPTPPPPYNEDFGKPVFPTN